MTVQVLGGIHCESQSVRLCMTPTTLTLPQEGPLLMLLPSLENPNPLYLPTDGHTAPIQTSTPKWYSLYLPCLNSILVMPYLIGISSMSFSHHAPKKWFQDGQEINVRIIHAFELHSDSSHRTAPFFAALSNEPWLKMNNNSGWNLGNESDEGWNEQP